MGSRIDVNFEALQQALLVWLYERFSMGELAVSLPVIATQLNLQQNVVELLLDRLVKDADVEILGRDGRGGILGVTFTRYQISRLGISQINRFSDAYREGVLRECGFAVISNQAVPASDRTVTLNHNQPDYQEAVAALDAAAKAFDEEHCLDNELGPEKSIIRDSLQTAKKYLQLKEIDFRIGMTLIVENLRNIATRFAKAVAGAAVKKLFEVAADKIYEILNSN